MSALLGGNPSCSLLCLYKHMSTTNSWNRIVVIYLYQLLRGQMELGASGGRINIVRKLRHCLVSPVIPAHRKAFTSIAFSSHGLAVKRLHWREWYWAPVPRKWCLCRFCRAHVEDEVHALINCPDDPTHSLLPLRDAMCLTWNVTAIVPDFCWHLDSRTLLLHLLYDKQLPVPIDKYIYNALAIFYSVHMYVPAPYLHSPLLLTQA
jgi:hypothetical protein